MSGIPRPLAADGAVTIDANARTLVVRPAKDARGLAKVLWSEGVRAQPESAAARYVGDAPTVWASGGGQARSPTVCAAMTAQCGSGSRPATRCTRSWSARQGCERPSSSTATPAEFSAFGSVAAERPGPDVFLSDHTATARRGMRGRRPESPPMLPGSPDIGMRSGRGKKAKRRKARLNPGYPQCPDG